MDRPASSASLPAARCPREAKCGPGTCARPSGGEKEGMVVEGTSRCTCLPSCPSNEWQLRVILVPSCLMVGGFLRNFAAHTSPSVSLPHGPSASNGPSPDADSCLWLRSKKRPNWAVANSRPQTSPGKALEGENVGSRQVSHVAPQGREAFPFNSARLMCLNSNRGWEARRQFDTRDIARCKLQNPPTNRSQRKHEVSLLRLAGPRLGPQTWTLRPVKQYAFSGSEMRVARFAVPQSCMMGLDTQYVRAKTTTTTPRNVSSIRILRGR